MQLVRVYNELPAAPPPPLIGSEFKFRIGPAQGLQLLVGQCWDIPFGVLDLDLDCSPADTRLGDRSNGIELAAGMILPLPQHLRGRQLEFKVRDQLLPNAYFYGPGAARSCLLAVLQHPDLTDAAIVPPNSIATSIDAPLHIGMYDPTGLDLDLAAGDCTSVPVWVGDAEGRITFTLNTAGAIAGAAEGTFYLDQCAVPPNIASPAHWIPQAWATVTLAAAVDLQADVQATNLAGPWVRWRFVWSAGAGARTAFIMATKGKGRQ